MYSEKGNRPGRGGRPPPQRGKPDTSSPVAAHTRRNQKEKFSVFIGTKDDERTFLQGLIIKATENTYGTDITRPLPSNRKLDLARTLLRDSSDMEISKLRKRVAEDILRYQTRRIKKENDDEVIEYHKDLLPQQPQSSYLDTAKYQEPSLTERATKQQDGEQAKAYPQGGIEEQKDSQSDDSYNEDNMEEAQRELFPAKWEPDALPMISSPPERDPFSHLAKPEPIVTMTRTQLQSFIVEQVQIQVQMHEDKREEQFKAERANQESLAKTALNSLNKIKNEIATETNQAQSMATTLKSEIASCQVIYKEWKANFQWLETMEAKLTNLKNEAIRNIKESEDMAVNMASNLVTRELAAREAKLMSIKLGINKQATSLVQQYTNKLKENAKQILTANETEYQTKHWANLDSLTSESEQELRLLQEEIREAREQWTLVKMENGITTRNATMEQIASMKDMITAVINQQSRDQKAIDSITADLILLKDIVEDNEHQDVSDKAVPPVTPSYQRYPQTQQHSPKIKNIFSVPKEQRQQAFEENTKNAQEIADTNAQQDRIRNNIRHFAHQSISHFPRDDQATAADIDAFYDQLVVVCKQYEIPIVARDDIREKGTAMPEIVEQFPSTLMDQIKHALYEKISNAIPDECTQLRNLLTFHGHGTQDGYHVLYNIMHDMCDDLKRLCPCWGPKWEENWDAITYCTQLKVHLRHHKHEIIRSPEAIAAEILQQAQRIPKYQPTATMLLSTLIMQSNNGGSLHDYTIGKLANDLKNGADVHSRHTVQPLINKFQQQRGRSRSPSPFKYRREVQCRVCKTFGHDIDDEGTTCRFGAQCFNCIQFFDNNGDEAKKNAVAYTAANNKKTISMLKNNPEVRKLLANDNAAQDFIMQVVKSSQNQEE